jgi:hypothetical protein
MATLLMAFGAKVERVVINDMNGSVFYARLILAAENQLHNRKLIELDARPSDSIALAVQQGCPVYVADVVWEAVEDVSGALAQIESKTLEENQAAEAEVAGGEAEFEGLFDVDDDDEEEDDDEEDYDDDEDDEDDYSEFEDEDDDEDDDFDLEDDEEDEEDEDDDGPERRL